MIIQPISELKNYNNLLEDVETGSPVYLTKNGKGIYAIVTIDDADEIMKQKNNQQFRKDVACDVEETTFFIKDIEELNKKLIKSKKAAKKNLFRYKNGEMFDKLKGDLNAGKI